MLHGLSEPALVIQGRVPPKVIHQILFYFRDQGVEVKNRSELVTLVFDLASKFAELNGRGLVGTNHEALDEMERVGITWEGNRDKRDIQKARQFDVLADMSVEDALAMRTQIADMRKKGRDLMPSVNKGMDAETEAALDRALEELENMDLEGLG